MLLTDFVLRILEKNPNYPPNHSLQCTELHCHYTIKIRSGYRKPPVKKNGGIKKSKFLSWRNLPIYRDEKYQCSAVEVTGAVQCSAGYR